MRILARGRVDHESHNATHERDIDQEMIPLLTDTDFGDGTVDVDVVGARRQRSLRSSVNDLKNGVSRAKIALWTRISGDAYFANLRVTPK